jgi:hypothetical protein
MYGTGWTGTHVTDRLIAFFRAHPGVTVSIDGGDPAPGTIDGAELVRVCRRVLGPTTPAATVLITYARARAGGTSIRDLCDGRGWKKPSLFRQVRTASHDVAAWLAHWRSRNIS